MSGDVDRGAALNDAADDPQPRVAVRCAQNDVAPTIAIGAPKLVLVPKPYQERPHRISVRLGTNSAFNGTGTLSSAQANTVRIFRAREGGTAIALPLQNISGRSLSEGLTLWVEGLAASPATNGTVLSLSLAGGNKNIYDSPATDMMTCLVASITLCQYKPVPGGGDPAPLADQITGQRNLHLQTGDFNAGRALLIVQPVQPADYAGQVTLRARNNKVQIFPYTSEVAAVAQVPTALPLNKDNPNLAGDNGKFWVEGVQYSRAVLDTGFTLDVQAVPGIEAHRANLTVVKAVFELYDMAPTAGGTQALIADGAKMNPGRSLMEQDGGTHFDRAKIVLKRAEPSGAFITDWAGNLEFVVWDVTAANAANPRVGLFTSRAGPAAAPAQIAHPGGVPYLGGLDLWAQGLVTSGAMRDTELRLRVADAEGYADHAAMTVHTLRVNEIYFNSVRDIYYARIPNAGSYLLPPALEPPRTLINPEDVRPAAGAPHWRRVVGATDNAQFSWPAAYVRRGAANAPNPTMEATFELFPKPANNAIVRIRPQAEGGGVTFNADAQAVTFAAGDSPRVVFPMLQLPATATRLDGTGPWRLRWRCDGWGPETRHTLFIVDKVPRAADGGQFLYEIFDWSCAWADGVTGTNDVFNRIWGQFSPVRGVGAHVTGLTYWGNWTDPSFGGNPAAFLAQDLAPAIRSQESFNPLLQGSATCIVFDRILINCCTLHGIDAAEIELTVDPTQFQRVGPGMGGAMMRNWQGLEWTDNNVHGQGNPASPPGWGSHWIASVKLTTLGVFSSWYYYDASYGVAPVDSPVPGAVNAAIDPINYEPLTVTTFLCSEVGSGNLHNFPPTADEPRLVGKVLFNSA